ncbi:ABC transporter transmembrane domain-containing protein [Knoellia sp. p5-6-4]|uniref:ABC transporter transmembrane domain-containing protein n=1 Tax=unclassified Knoellia TaxID=2618719 RepID=UPI0023DC4B73|nr:ABC transporter transmembrane domain-containing protein [Knoellia sp. p5-6-4]MDF2145363.1 ABC transporter transmembrane domain-containing protein [Knoellia sp. p5-6-4]
MRASTKRRGDARRTLAMFRQYSGGRRAGFLPSVLLMAVEAGTAILVPVVIGAFFTYLEKGTLWRPLNLEVPKDIAIPVFAGSLIAFTALNSLSDAASEIRLAEAGRTLGYHLRRALFSHLQKLSLAFHLRRSTGDVLTRITGDVQAVEEFVTDSFKDLVGSVMLLAGTLAYLFYQSPRIALLAMVIVPLLSSVSAFFARRIKASSKEMRAREGDLATTAQEMLTTISVVQTYGRAGHEQEKFDRESRSAMGAILRTARLEALFGLTVSVLEATIIALLVLVGGGLVESDRLPAGVLVAFVMLIQNMFKPTRRIIKQWNRVAKVYASVERIDELLAREPGVQDAPDAREAPPLSGAIEFRDVSFAYQQQGAGDLDGEPQRLTLQSVSFTLEAGEVVALVGHSGAGKSTIAQLVPRLYDPQSGAVLIDGHDIRTFTVDSLRAQISMVLQETILLRGTVSENIAYGREGATREEVERAARRAHAHDFITALPQGYDTVLGERAATLSGGQRQRLAIARAFIRDTPILVLDEPTTGLDAVASASVASALQSLLEGRSAVIVSHDLNLIRNVDRVLILSGGRILEEGTPADLLERGGLYAELYASQFGEAVAEAVGAGGEPEPAQNQYLRSALQPAGPRAEEALEPDLVLERASAPRGTGLEAWPAGDSAADGEVEADTTFETVLHDAIPLPASAQEFRRLRGWVAAGAGPGPARADLDAGRSPELARALPGLGDALAPTAVADHLQRMLDPEWDLEACHVDKVLIAVEEGTRLRYRLHLRDRHSGEVAEHFVAGRLFPDTDRAERYAAGLAAVARPGTGEPVFAAPVHTVEGLHLVLHAFPLDPNLPGLAEAVDPARMGALLEPVLPSALRGLELEACRPEVVKYAVGDHAVVRYELLWRVSPSRRTVRQVVYGKVFPDDRGEHLESTLAFLLERLRGGAASPATFLLPRFLTYLPQLRLVVTEALPGTPQVQDLVRAWVAGGGRSEEGAVRGQVTAEGALGTCAGIAASLHLPVRDSLVLPGSALPGGRVRTLGSEVERVRACVESLSRYTPDLAAALRDRLDSVAHAAEREPLPLLVAHGDFTPKEVLLDGPISAVFDLDSATAAEPALDLGHFAAHLALVVARASAGTAQPQPARGAVLQRLFLSEYLRLRPDLDPDAVLDRVAAYRVLALLEVAVRSWHQLKPERLAVAMSLLERSQGVRHRTYT